MAPPIRSSFSFPSPSPDQEVLETYYTGIPSFGKLCGTTDPFLQRNADWQPARDGTWIVGKRLATVGSHPITAYFSFGKPLSDQDLATRIIVTIKRSGLPCNSFDILRIGDAPLQTCDLPVKLLIKVEPGQVDWADGTSLAYRCRLDLHLFGLNDVHCEVLEAQVGATAGDNLTSSPLSPEPITSPLAPFWPIDKDWMYPWRRCVLPFTPVLGQCIGSPNLPKKKGSTGFYLRVSTKAGTRYTDCVVTCRHCLVADTDGRTINLATSVESITDHEQPMQVVQPAHHEDVKKELDAKKQHLQATIENLELKEIVSGLVDAGRQYLTGLRQELDHLEAFLTYYDSIANNHKIGYIIASPPISAQAVSSRQTIRRDWAVIHLDQSKFHLRDDLPPKNLFCLVDLPQNILLDLSPSGQTFAVVQGCPDDLPGLDMLTIDKYITVDYLQRQMEIIKRRNSQAEGDTEPIHLDVIKSGFQTGTTHGYLNEIGSYIEHGNSYSQNLCILSRGKGPFSDKGAFSDKGDSGSLVSMLCRPEDDKMHDPVVVAAGLLWGGCESEKFCRDITYAIPLEHILNDVKQFFSGNEDDVGDQVEISNMEAWEPISVTSSAASAS